MHGSTFLCIFRRRKTRFILPVLFFVIVIVYSVLITIIDESEPSRLNYFLDGDDYLKLGFIVETAGCRILRVSAWDKSILPFLSSENPYPDCKRNRRWTYIKNNELIINTTAIYESGYSLSSVSCCYRAIERVHQSPHRYDLNADSRVIFSTPCRPMNVTNPLKDEFIRIQCTSKYWPWAMDVIYRDFHAAPQLTKTSKAIKKVLYWEKLLGRVDNSTRKSQTDASFFKKLGLSNAQGLKATNLGQSNHGYRNVPPNVVILGLDSTSRQNFNRNMKKTREYLRSIGAVEMLGYNKVADGTFGNTLAFLTGYLRKDLEKVCLFSDATNIYPCPFIFKEYDEANYLTLFMEDGRTFNSDVRAGFVEQPTDFYFRPFILALNDHHPGSHPDNLYALNCVGGKNLVEIILKYINDALSFTSRNNTPVFAYSWMTNVGHDDFNGIKFGDDHYLDFLRNLDLSNTILFVLGDHGYRFKRIRETFAGYLEDKLPAFWAYLPESVRRRFPTWLPSLKRNSERLTSPLDFYHTLAQILTTFTSEEKFPDAKSPTGEIIPRMHGQTLLEDVPLTRKCQDAGIGENWCACGFPRRLPTNNSQIIAAAKKAISDLNYKLPKVCALLKLQKITASGMVKEGSSKENVTYVVAFETSPGGFLFEATVRAVVKLGYFEVIGDIQRMNQISKWHTRCVGYSDAEKFCYCASRGSSYA